MQGKIYFQVRVAICDDLEEKLKQNSKEFTAFDRDEESIKYYKVEGEGNDAIYITASYIRKGVDMITDYYTAILIVHGQDREKVTTRMGELEKSLGIQFKPAPEALMRRYRMMFGNSF
ncbi:MAG: hypothetical protein V1645_02400 [archaeon]